ncbi:MAG: bifunctional metallophosphatase/5'-nucleotidase [Muribaculaceae bacterium]|nr:bifunctional metallophosphatase/5'-nucleotidase [Muribaculaceae bacterium]
MNISTLLKAAAPLVGAAALCLGASAERLVILHTNDTHSSIDPASNGTGGILQRKAIIDSVRKAEKNVITVDAGDMVQGSLYFKYFRGDVEYPLMDMTGYDIRILGNHEFDNGMKDLAEKYRDVKGARLSSNYDFSGTELEGIFSPYVIKKVGGKKIGFIGLNVDPESLISKNNIDVRFKEIIPEANRLAAFLKNEKRCDLVVAVTHIGYEKENDKTTDPELIAASRDIDIVIGGHSHTLIDPNHPEKYPSLLPNADGKPVRVVQTGKYGRYVGKITVDLDNLKGASGEDFGYELIPVTDRFPDDKLDKKMKAFIEPYRHIVDSVGGRVIARAAYGMKNGERVGPMANMTADLTFDYLRHKADSLRSAGVEIGEVDMAIMNVGGIRQDMPEGNITEGQILSTYPFSNYFVIVEIKGSDLIDALAVGARKGGEGISRNVRVVTDKDGGLRRVVIDGEEMDPEKNYILATINYAAEGNDDMVSLARHRLIWTDDVEVAAPTLRWFVRQGELGLPVAPDPNPRYVVDTSL